MVLPVNTYIVEPPGGGTMLVEFAIDSSEQAAEGTQAASS